MKRFFTILIMLCPILLLAQPPANDDCSNAEVLTISMGQAEVIVDITDATDSPEDECDEPGVWYTFMPNAAVEGYRVTTLNQDGNCDNDDTQIHVFRGADCNSFTELTDGCLDENSSDCNDHEFFVFANDATGPIYIHVAQDDPDDALIYRLLVEEVELPDNDDCANAQELFFSNGEASVIVDMEFATPGDLEDCDEGGVWYSFVPNNPSVGAYRIITLSEDGDCDDEDTEIHVFRGADCNSFTELTDGCQDDDNTGCNNNEQFSFPNESNERIYIHVARNDLEDDPVSRLLIREILLPDNDDCVDAIRIPLSLDGNTNLLVDIGAATQGVLEECDEGGIWYSFTLPSSGPITISTKSADPNTCSDEDDSEIHVFRGPDCDNLTELTDGCQDDDNTDCENNESFTFDGEADDLIYVLVAKNDTDANSRYTLSIESPVLFAAEDLPVYNRKQVLLMMVLLVGLGSLTIYRFLK